MNDSIDISLVIPFHNEEDSLKELIPLILTSISKIPKTVEVILINDVSNDRSPEVVRHFQKDNPNIFLLELEKRGGQTGAYQIAFERAQGDYIIRLDADLQDDPKDLYKFIEHIDRDADLVMGIRECRKHSRILRFASGFYDLMILLLFNSPLHSNSGSYIAFKTKFVRNIPWQKNDHRYIPLIVMKRGAIDIREVFVSHSERKYGDSKYQPLRKLVLGIPEVFRFLIRYINGYYNFK